MATASTPAPPNYEGQHQQKWLALQDSIELLPREVSDISDMFDDIPADVPPDAARPKRARHRKPKPGVTTVRPMIRLTGNRRYLLTVIAKACWGDSAETFISRELLMDKTKMVDSTYDECNYDLQAAGLLEMRWEKLPGRWRRYWIVKRDRINTIIGPGVDPQVLIDAIQAVAQQGACAATVACSTARIVPTKRKLYTLAKEMGSWVNITTIADPKDDKKALLTVVLGSGPAPDDEEDDEDLSVLAVTPPPASAVKQDAVNPTPQKVSAKLAAPQPVKPEVSVQVAEPEMKRKSPPTAPLSLADASIAIRDRLLVACGEYVPTAEEAKHEGWLRSSNSIYKLISDVAGGFDKNVPAAIETVTVRLKRLLAEPDCVARLTDSEYRSPAHAFMRICSEMAEAAA